MFVVTKRSNLGFSVLFKHTSNRLTVIVGICFQWCCLHGICQTIVCSAQLEAVSDMQGVGLFWAKRKLDPMSTAAICCQHVSKASIFWHDDMKFCWLGLPTSITPPPPPTPRFPWRFFPKEWKQTGHSSLFRQWYYVIQTWLWVRVYSNLPFGL